MEKSSNSKSVKSEKKKFSVFNNEYNVIESLGEGKTSRVYLCHELKDPTKKVALKLVRQDFLSKDKAAIKSIEQEIQILRGLDHKHINKIIGYGSDGKIVKPSGREICNLVYIILEYVPNGLFFDLCQAAGGMGEEGGRFFMEQLKEVISYMQEKKAVHRDLKLENILVDDGLQLKVCDFGFATYKKITKLSSYRGTKTYMAPEIKEGKTYDGRLTDIFSAGVILFIIVLGIFPFSEAKKDEYYYKLIYEGKLEKYWKKTGGENLSAEFKDLVLKMLAYNPAKRPTIDEIKVHPWMKKQFEKKKAQKDIMQTLKENNFEQATNDSDSTKITSTSKKSK